MADTFVNVTVASVDHEGNTYDVFRCGRYCRMVNRQTGASQSLVFRDGEWHDLPDEYTDVLFGDPTAPKPQGVIHCH